MADTIAINPGARLEALGLMLPKPWGSVPGRAQPREASETGTPAPLVLGPGVKVHAEFVRIVGRRVMISGHLPIDAEGRVSGPFGRVGAEVPVEAAEESAHRLMLGIFASLVRELGSLDRVGAWLHLYGMVNAAPDFHDYPRVINPASRLIYEVFGDDVGKHARIAIGIGGLPFNAPVEIAAELELRN